MISKSPFLRRGASECRLSAAAAIDRAPLDISSARARAAAAAAAAAAAHSTASRHAGKLGEVWELFPAAERGLEPPAARAARLAAEVALLEREAAEEAVAAAAAGQVGVLPWACREDCPNDSFPKRFGDLFFPESKVL